MVLASPGCPIVSFLVPSETDEGLLEYSLEFCEIVSGLSEKVLGLIGHVWHEQGLECHKLWRVWVSETKGVICPG